MKSYYLRIDGDLIMIDGNFKKLHKTAATALKNGKGVMANITNESKQCDFFLRLAFQKNGRKSK